MAFNSTTFCKKLLFPLLFSLSPFISPLLKKKEKKKSGVKKKQRSKGTSMIKGKTLFMNSIASIIPARIKSIRERFRVLSGERFVPSENIEIPVIAPAFPRTLNNRREEKKGNVTYFLDRHP